ncbi:hypothetical protein [Streptomyces montanisoli]|uniref:Asp23/Gls24 family envelope stress response protein n=1 Tax=Streptomyces montanisoli TaxID=2798581 RepID=A0A940M772_9ACTN|nr:hypothetical protein [Streptomyces montanisoli]MBP0457440.1 hypothetical protein [Streptomyces montanisoli]
MTQGPPRAPGEPASRGATVISERATRRIAAQAAREALESRPHTAARASADTRRGRTKIALEVDLPYPVDIDGVCGQVRRHVGSRTLELTGVPVTSVEVLVGRLTPVHALDAERLV